MCVTRFWNISYCLRQCLTKFKFMGPPLPEPFWLTESKALLSSKNSKCMHGGLWTNGRCDSPYSSVLKHKKGIANLQWIGLGLTCNFNIIELPTLWKHILAMNRVLQWVLVYYHIPNILVLAMPSDCETFHWGHPIIDV